MQCICICVHLNIRAGSIPKLFDFDSMIWTIFDFDFGRFWQIFKERFFHDFDSEKLSQNHRFFDFDKYQPSKKLCFLLFKPKNWVELGRFQNYSIPIFNDFGKYSKIDFFMISILKNWVKIVDFSITIKIDPALLNIGFAIIGLSASKNFIILARMVVLLIEICSFLLNMAKWDKKISLQRKTQHTKYLGNNI